MFCPTRAECGIRQRSTASCLSALSRAAGRPLPLPPPRRRQQRAIAAVGEGVPCFVHIHDYRAAGTHGCLTSPPPLTLARDVRAIAQSPPRGESNVADNPPSQTLLPQAIQVLAIDSNRTLDDLGRRLVPLRNFLAANPGDEFFITNRACTPPLLSIL